jgi:Ser/Thr protein kinase RdoA (MazF antagonist)
MIDHPARVPAAVLARFGVDERDAVVEPLGRGHIHRTYLVRGAATPFVLQRLNETVFPEPDRLAGNIERVTDALEAARARGDYALEWPAPLKDAEGNALVRFSGETWRASSHIGGTYAVDEVDTPRRARRGADAFGRFCAALVTVDPQDLAELIPDFHNLDRRLAQLEQAVLADPAGRVGSAAAEIDFCRQQHPLAAALGAAQVELPRHVCHNDTKINNLLFDGNDHLPRAVIDLDTCMPGWWMHDFGDIIRTFCSAEPEDSTRLDRVRVREHVFAAACRGFVEPLAPHFSANERDSLWLGARGIGFVIGVRFLTDYLEGDRYFAVSRGAQNLERARNQFTLHRDLTDRENELRPHLAG